MTSSAPVFIGLGSNLGNGILTLQLAWRRLGEDTSVELARLSHPYVSEPVGMESENLFTNAVGMVHTALSAHQFLAFLLQVEAEFGRKRDPQAMGYQDRSLDLDILYFGEESIDTPKLILPHPHIEKRLFVLAPLAEIAPGFCDPVAGVSVERKQELLLEQVRSGMEEPQTLKVVSWDTETVLEETINHG